MKSRDWWFVAILLLIIMPQPATLAMYWPDLAFLLAVVAPAKLRSPLVLLLLGLVLDVILHTPFGVTSIKMLLASMLVSVMVTQKRRVDYSRLAMMMVPVVLIGRLPEFVLDKVSGVHINLIAMLTSSLITIAIAGYLLATSNQKKAI